MAPPFEWPFDLDVPVRFRDLDGFGHVNNAVFLTFFEQARIDCYLRLLGRSGPFEAGAGLNFVVARAEIDYLSPVRSGDVVRISVRPARVGRSSFDLSYAAHRIGGEPVARGRTVQVAYDHETGRSRPLSGELTALLREGLPAEQPS